MPLSEYADISPACVIKDPRTGHPPLKVFEIVFVIEAYSGYSCENVADFLAYYFRPKYEKCDITKVQDIFADCLVEPESLEDWLGRGHGQPVIDQVVEQFKEKFDKIP